MDWESKFSTIVRETETNLAKVKEKLGSARASSFAALKFNSNPSLDKLSLLDDVVTRQSSAMNSHLNGFSASNPLPLKSDPYQPVTNGHSNVGDDLDLVPLDRSPGVIVILQERMDAQLKTIETLTRSVKQLEEERDRYGKEVTTLREDVALLTSRLGNQGLDPHTERKLEQWRRDLKNEIHLVQSSIHLQRTKDNDSHYHDNQQASSVTVLVREVQDMRRSMQEERDSVRRDLDSIRSRLGKLELDVASAISDSRDFSRKQETMDRNIRDLTSSHSIATRDLSRTLGERSMDKHEIAELRGSLRNIQDKIGSMEDQISREESSLRQQIKDQKHCSIKVTKSVASDVLDDLSPDTSDLEVSSASLDDLDSYSALNPVIDTEPRLELYEDHEKLHLDDLDLDLSTDGANSYVDVLDFDDELK